MNDQAGGAGTREGLFSGLKNVVATLVAIGKTRAELLVLEVEEEKHRFVALLSKTAWVTFLLFMGVITAVLSIAFAFWEQRVIVCGLFALIFIGCGVALLGSLKQDISRPSSLFRRSLSELETDLQQLRGSHEHRE